MAPVLDVSNALNWVHFYSITLYAQPTPVLNVYYPIPQHNLPVVLDKRTLAVGSSSSQAKPTWKLGFYLVGFINVPGIGKARVLNTRVPLGLSLIRLPNLHDQFSIRADIPKWHKEMTIDIWKYIGVETDS